MKSNNELILKRSTIIITLRCTLKCKLCAAFVPSYTNPPHYSYSTIAKTLDKFFSIVDFVDKLSISGGEPLAHEDLSKIVEKAMEHCNKFNTLQIITNGTLVPTAEQLQTFYKNKSRIHFLIDHYGEYSNRIDDLVNALNENEISYTIHKYFGDNTHCGGWVDFGNLEKKHSKKEATELIKKCVNAKMGYCFSIWNGILHPCNISSRLFILGKYSKDSTDFVDLFDESANIDELKRKIKNIMKLPVLEACSCCNGFCEDSPRFIPAEQRS